MKSFNLKSVKGPLLKQILPFFLVSIAIVFTLVFFIHPKGSYSRLFYLYLNGSLFFLSAVAYFLTFKEHYKVALYFSFIITIVGTWSPLIFYSQQGSEYMFMVIYLVLPILYSSIQFSLSFTLIFTLTQIIFVLFITMSTPFLTLFDQTNFIFFMILISFFGIITNNVSKAKTKELQEGAIQDHLTGLFNRRYLDATVINIIKQKGSKDLYFGVVMCDVDNFKRYNDTYGHSTGDIILQRVAKVLLEETRLHDIVCRYGGDEFVVITTNSDKEHVYKTASHLSKRIHNMDFTELGDSFPAVSLSMGIAIYPFNGTTYEELLDCADQNLNKAKKSGKNRVAY
ncbi:MAG: sensor domain-containing diguanylate cyclase [Spirochaetia bacterium]|nr:sensor domain-containing diguanylate cyclase [Spirochaetia bacterium]